MSINPNRAAVLAAQAANDFREVVLAADLTTRTDDATTVRNTLRSESIGRAWDAYHDAVVTMCASIGVTDEDAIAVLMTALTAATNPEIK